MRDYKQQQGIALDPQRIQINPAKRQVAKLCLNSFWGKKLFRVLNYVTQTSIVSDPDELFKFLFSGKYDVKYFHFLNPDACLIQWS